MLSELQISNFALIEKQTISFGPGLNVISGESGAGKSVILHALELILGARPRANFIRSGADSLEVEAVFDLRNVAPNILHGLPDLARVDELALSRSVTMSGRNKVYVNGTLATVTLLQEITGKLVNICGQSQHVRLLDSEYHLELVDGFAGNLNLVQRYTSAFTAWRNQRDELERLETRLQRNIMRRAELEFMLEELSAAELSPGIREELESQVKRLSQAEHLISGTQNICESMNVEEGILERLQQVGAKLHELQRFDKDLSKLVTLFSSARTELVEFESDLRGYLAGIEVDDAALSQLRDRLAEVARLERKYKTNDRGLVDLLASAREEVAALNAAENIEARRSELARLKQEVLKLGAELLASRQKAGRTLSRAVENELAELNMKDAQLKLSFTALAEPSLKGTEKIEILISANKGEPPQALRQVASGGELSRIMLVLKKVLREQSGVNVLVFDEVDSGVSGSVARAVGEKLKALARDSQVLCITHLAQVASLADHHFLVDKKLGKRTVSEIRELVEQEKVDEIARMLAGYEITAATRESARELMSSKPQ